MKFSSTSADDVTVVTFPHTTGTGDNRLLLVGIAWNCGSTNRTITSITFTPDGGSAVGLSEVITQLGYNTSNPRYSAIYSLLNPPMEQDGTVTITFSGSVSNGIMAGAANFSGVDQTTPFGSAIGANGNSITPSVELTGLSGDELVFDNVFLGASGTSYNLTAGEVRTIVNPLTSPIAVFSQHRTGYIKFCHYELECWYCKLLGYCCRAINPAPASPPPTI